MGAKTSCSCCREQPIAGTPADVAMQIKKLTDQQAVVMHSYAKSFPSDYKDYKEKHRANDIEQARADIWETERCAVNNFEQGYGKATPGPQPAVPLPPLPPPDTQDGGNGSASPFTDWNCSATITSGQDGGNERKESEKRDGDRKSSKISMNSTSSRRDLKVMVSEFRSKAASSGIPCNLDVSRSKSGKLVLEGMKNFKDTHFKLVNALGDSILEMPLGSLHVYDYDQMKEHCFAHHGGASESPREYLNGSREADVKAVSDVKPLEKVFMSMSSTRHVKQQLKELEGTEEQKLCVFLVAKEDAVCILLENDDMRSQTAMSLRMLSDFARHRQNAGLSDSGTIISSNS